MSAISPASSPCGSNASSRRRRNLEHFPPKWTPVRRRKCDKTNKPSAHHGAFVTTVVCFFLTEIGDKTQIATAALAARFETVWLVVIGTTLGMVAANLPAVL